MELIKSISNNQNDIIKSILRLYIKKSHFDLDPTYSKGVFYKDIEAPVFKSDIDPFDSTIIQSDCRNLWLEDESINSIMFDPPFLATKGPSLKKYDNSNKILKRFSVFKNIKRIFLIFQILKLLVVVEKRRKTMNFSINDLHDIATKSRSVCAEQERENIYKYFRRKKNTIYNQIKDIALRGYFNCIIEADFFVQYEENIELILQFLKQEMFFEDSVTLIENQLPHSEFNVITDRPIKSITRPYFKFMVSW